ncbi:hypothetical protein GA0074692_1151 [Micromonospora pallida]|uniref:Uncharacterized protein n=1 Tax=Micromonospora pallida TaxID=145854 RepID=A0A1C6RW99_9ACTN|nr:hypothetical protein [Micromonospora pallida]SCL21342.1 hypothetical protein GA0074692_1151 [Micromonospora pallida]
MTGAAMSMFAALLDRSVARIGELAADGRQFDRQAVAAIADVWDNNTFPLFETALGCPAWLRERRARAALVWMADLGPSRRAWMIEQAAVAGHRLEPLLPPLVHGGAHYRDYRGQVQPGTAPLTAAAVESVAKDYDLARAQVRVVQVERAGHKLGGYVAVAAPRRYVMPGGHGDAVVQLTLSDVQDVRFDSGDEFGATLAADTAGVEIRVGAQGRLLAASASIGFDDPSWHLSHAGQSADAYTPRGHSTRRNPRQSKRPLVQGGALEAAVVLRQAMLEMRTVRYAMRVGRVPLRELCDAFAGAGTDVLTAAGQRGAERDQLFRRLAEQWIAGNPSLARGVADWFPDDHWTRAVIPSGSPQPPVADMPGQAQLTLADYTATHTQYGVVRDASAVVNLAVPDGGDTWGLRAMRFPRPVRLSLRTAALIAPHTVSHTAEASLSLGADAFTVTSREPDDG